MTDNCNYYVGVTGMVRSAYNGIIVKRFEVPVSDYSEFNSFPKALKEARRQRDQWLQDRKKEKEITVK